MMIVRRRGLWVMKTMLLLEAVGLDSGSDCVYVEDEDAWQDGPKWSLSVEDTDEKVVGRIKRREGFGRKEANKAKKRRGR